MTTVRSTGVAGPGRAGTLGAGSVALALLALAAWTFSRVAQGATWQPWDGDYSDVGRLSSWLIESISEPQFYAVAPAGALLLFGGLIGHVAHRRSWRWQGFVQACGTGLWPWVAGSALAGLVLGTVAWGWTLGSGSWQPLFVPLVSVAPAIVVLYGPGWRIGLSAAVLGALLTPPASILAVEYLCGPLVFHPSSVPPRACGSPRSWRSGSARGSGGCLPRAPGAQGPNATRPLADPRCCGYPAVRWPTSPRRSSSATNGRAPCSSWAPSPPT
ncbi:hypothetical protein ACQPXM_00885 [Kribbella sp. CA-253562]|uniref:hypothetical protein n=1 Tax=Kribbella sp. CA-253562 TaxID=3239942 RepID=UPI003D92542E